MIKLIGILIVVIGFILKIDTLFTVLLAGVATGIVAGLDFNQIFTILGDSFVSNRGVSLFILTLPVIGVLERYGLKQRAVSLIEKLKRLTTGKVLTIYMIARQIAGLSNSNELKESDEEAIKALSAASENYGNFYGQNLFAGSSGVLLIASTLTQFGYNVTGLNIVKASTIMAVIALVVATIQFTLYDKKLNKSHKK